MAFKKKTWVDRLVEFPGRRRLTNVATGETTVYDVARNEGTVSKEGDPYNAHNMNDLEQRIADEFSQINSKIDTAEVETAEISSANLDEKIRFVRAGKIVCFTYPYNIKNCPAGQIVLGNVPNNMKPINGYVTMNCYSCIIQISINERGEIYAYNYGSTITSLTACRFSGAYICQ